MALVSYHTTQDFNTPLWFSPPNSDWRVADERGSVPLSDTPSIDHPAYRHQLEEYVEATARHLKDHPAVLAYQLLNEPRYDQTRLYDYSTHSVEMFVAWLKQNYGNVERLNKTWDTTFTSIQRRAAPARWPRRAVNAIRRETMDRSAAVRGGWCGACTLHRQGLSLGRPVNPATHFRAPTLRLPQLRYNFPTTIRRKP